MDIILYHGMCIFSVIVCHDIYHFLLEDQMRNCSLITGRNVCFWLIK